MAFINNTEYGIVSDREIASILGNFTPGMIINMLDDILNDRIRPYSSNIGNLVTAYELNYKGTIAQCPIVESELTELRLATYEGIMKKICEYHNLEYELDPGMDIYTIALYTYAFLVSDFKNNITQFYRNFIMKERNNIYESLHLADMKKGKDSSSSYSKKIYKGGNQKISVIHANLDYVITQMGAFDIDFPTIIEFVYYGNKPLIRLLQNVLSDNGDFYHRFYVETMNGIYRAELITDIRLLLQPAPMSNIEEYIEGEPESNE